MLYLNNIRCSCNVQNKPKEFFKKCSIDCTRRLASVGASVHGTGETNDYGTIQIAKTDHSQEYGWLNVRDCGASGSEFKTTAATVSGSQKITLADPGDFKVGQGVMVSKCNIRYEKIQMWGTGLPYLNRKPVENSVEIRGYDGTAGSWMVYVIDIKPSAKPAFRWTDDLSHTWQPEVPITHDWQTLSGGVEIKLNQRDWEAGYVIAFGARDQLISRIEKIEGNVLTLQDEANKTVSDAVVRHNDTAALQEAVDKAISEKLNVFVPVGHFMLAKTIAVNKASAIIVEGASSVDTVLDISEGEGPCFSLNEGTEVTIRNFRMIGFMGFDERDKAGELGVKGSSYVWGFWLKHCKGVNIRNTERVLVENCHASRMSGEVFSSSCRGRGTVKSGQSYTKSITYLRCSVTDCARNAFDDVLGFAENTSVLNCRVVDVGGNAWEGCVRWGKFIGNYVRNSGPVATGNLGAAKIIDDKTYPDLGSGQHIIADNVFEGSVPYGGCAIRSNRGATQVIIRNNLFINYNSSGVKIDNVPSTSESISSNTTIVGNIFDMTCIGQKSIPRAAITVGINDTIISDNQIYVRGKADPLVTAIRLLEPALNVIAHDNLIRNCGTGVLAESLEARVGEFVDDRTILLITRPAGLPSLRISADAYKGWSMVWKPYKGIEPQSGISVIEAFDPETLRVKLKEPHPSKTGDRFEFIATSVNWNIHDNTITDCLRPVVFNSYGSKTSMFNNNLIIRNSTAGVPVAIEVHGCFQLKGNRLIGFDEENATALALFPDAAGRAGKSQYQGNIFENCYEVVTEKKPGLWKNSLIKDNMTIDCVNKIPR